MKRHVESQLRQNMTALDAHGLDWNGCAESLSMGELATICDRWLICIVKIKKDVYGHMAVVYVRD